MKARIFAILFICIILTGCAKMSCVEYLKQPIEDIARIELVYNQSFEQRDVLYTLTDKELDEFITELPKLTISKYSVPQGYLGYLSIDITYKDGSIQLIGSESSKYINAYDPNNIKADEHHHIAYSVLYELFSRYVDNNVLASLRQANCSHES